MSISLPVILYCPQCLTSLELSLLTQSLLYTYKLPWVHEDSLISNDYGYHEKIAIYRFPDNSPHSVWEPVSV